MLLPLIGATINFLAGAWLQKTFGKRAISLVGCGVVLAAFLLAARAFFGMIRCRRKIASCSTTCGSGSTSAD